MNGRTINLIRADNEIMNKNNSRFQYFLALIYFVYGIYFMIKGNFFIQNSDTILGLSAVIIVIVTTVYRIKKNNIYKKLQFELNDEYIRYRYSIKNHIIIKLKELDYIELKVLEIIFLLKNGEKKEFHLENLSYKSVLQVKEEIKNFATNKNIQLK